MRALPSSAVPPDRSCACGETARCVGQSIERAKGIPVGTKYEYRCDGCKQHFATHSAGGIAFVAFGALFLSSIAWLLVAHPPGSAVGAEENNRWAGWVLCGFAAIMWAMLGARLLALQRHPVIRK